MMAIPRVRVWKLIAILLSTSFLLTAQTSEAPKPNGEKYLLKEGTEVNLKFSEALSSKTAAEDDRVNFELVDDLKVGDVVVARAGTKAVGSVTHAKKSGMMGKGGELNIRLEYLKVGDTRVRLRANKGKEGEDKVGATVALTILFGPLGLLKHGKNVEVKAGALLKSFVDEDIRLPAVEK
ncbi:MAG: hypothetical protein JWM21_988 [Acidobacteria bacterium]|nr:hypothetical protein [Acidobacteriota bacterium]